LAPSFEEETRGKWSREDGFAEGADAGTLGMREGVGSGAGLQFRFTRERGRQLEKKEPTGGPWVAARERGKRELRASWADWLGWLTRVGPVASFSIFCSVYFFIFCFHFLIV
jgi:hypothetical protein